MVHVQRKLRAQWETCCCASSMHVNHRKPGALALSPKATDLSAPTQFPTVVTGQFAGVPLKQDPHLIATPCVAPPIFGANHAVKGRRPGCYPHHLESLHGR